MIFKEFLRPRAGPLPVRAAVVRPDLDRVAPPRDHQPAIAIEPVGPDLTAIKAWQSPGLQRTAQGSQESDVDRLVHPCRQAGEGAGDRKLMSEAGCHTFP